jgi:hypothetical protein
MKAAQTTIESLFRLSQILKEEASEVALAINREIELELVAVWSNILNLSVHSLQFDTALDAVIALSTLSHVSTTDSSHWKNCLRTLIFSVCSIRNIFWLCSLPDSLIGPDGVTYIDLTKEITQQMENLARSSDLMSLPTGANGISSEESATSLGNFYDCIAAYLVSKRQYMECARLQYQLVQRLGGSEDSTSISLVQLKLQLRFFLFLLNHIFQMFVTCSQRFVVSSSRSTIFCLSPKTKSAFDKLEGDRL